MHCPTLLQDVFVAQNFFTTFLHQQQTFFLVLQDGKLVNPLQMSFPIPIRRIAHKKIKIFIVICNELY